MCDYLSIGQVSKLLDISTYNLRYYEREGLIKPAYNDENGYRMFDLDAVYKISTIMLLRNSNLSLATIKDLMNDFTTSHFDKKLLESLNLIQEEIKRLQVLESLVNSKHKKLQMITQSFQLKRFEDRTVGHYDVRDYDDEMTLKTFYKKYHMHTGSSILENDYYILREDCLICGAKAKTQEEPSTYFEAGQYLSYQFKVHSEDEYTEYINKFFRQIKENGYKIKSELLLIFDPDYYFLEEYYIAELQIKIET